MKNILFILLLCFIQSLASAQEGCMDIGTNFHFFDAGVFKDLKLSSSTFFTRNATYVGDDNDWDSGLANTMPQNSAGYPLQIPFNHPSTGEPQIAAFTIGGYSQNYKTGNYVMLYDGTATFNFVEWTAATVTNSSPGRIEFTINAVDENGVHIEILSSPASDPIDNIRIVETSFESNFESAPLYPEFYEKSDEFISLRFMDWMHTNYHPAATWSERTSPNFHTQNVDGTGMSWEHIIEICNELGKDAWINVPHLADENYIDSMAVLFRDLLDPGLSIYLEYSNECWNWIFEQTYWLDTAQPFQIGSWNYGYYSHRVFQRWDAVFAGQEHRIQTVLAGHDYFVLDALYYFDQQGNTDLVDKVSYPGYVGLSEADYEELNTLGASATAENVMEMLRGNMAENFYWMQQFKSLIADAYDKEFVMYEGGQHITPEWFGLDTTYNQALYDAQNHPDMYNFYQEMLSYYQDSLDVTLFMNYVLASPQESSFGSWGLVETYFTPAPYSQKWNAVMDWRNNNTACSTSIKSSPTQSSGISIFPNPTTGIVEIQCELDGNISLFDNQGRLISSYNSSQNSIDLSNLPQGIYWIKIDSQQGSSTQKIVKI